MTNVTYVCQEFLNRPNVGSFTTVCAKTPLEINFIISNRVIYEMNVLTDECKSLHM